jgi:hypothetical protein
LKVIYFFERTAQDSAYFIDIAEENYKTMTLADHRQEKRKKEKEKTNHPVGLGPQHG